MVKSLALAAVMVVAGGSITVAGERGHGWRLDSYSTSASGRAWYFRPLGPPDDGVRQLKEPAGMNRCDMAGFIGAIEVLNPDPGHPSCVGGEFVGP